MSNQKDLTNKKFGRLTAKYPVKGANRIMWHCICECGKECDVRADALVSKRTKSCGCLLKDKWNWHMNSNGELESYVIKYHRLYNIYKSMVDRCYNPNRKDFHRYGGRGITIVEEWYDMNDIHYGLKNFIEWSLHNGYNLSDEQLDVPDRPSIDRIDNDGPYAPWNCKWVPFKYQLLNTRRNRYIYDGSSQLTYSEFERKYKLKEGEVSSKIQNNWSMHAIVFYANHVEMGIHRFRGNYYDAFGFQVIIPKINKNTGDI